MISTRIDLTENRDFSGGLLRDIDRLDNSISNAEFARWRSLQDIMTNEEYNLLRRMESMFGMRTHYSEAYNVFRKDEVGFFSNLREYCARCGKYIFPWYRHYRELCKECDDIINHSKIPWKPTHQAFIRDDAKDILQMR